MSVRFMTFFGDHRSCGDLVPIRPAYRLAGSLATRGPPSRERAPVSSTAGPAAHLSVGTEPVHLEALLCNVPTDRRSVLAGRFSSVLSLEDTTTLARLQLLSRRGVPCHRK